MANQFSTPRRSVQRLGVAAGAGPEAADLSASQNMLAFRESESATTAGPDASYSSRASVSGALVRAPAVTPKAGAGTGIQYPHSQASLEREYKPGDLK
jgi:hypothetical protein